MGMGRPLVQSIVTISTMCMPILSLAQPNRRGLGPAFPSNTGLIEEWSPWYSMKDQDGSEYNDFDIAYWPGAQGLPAPPRDFPTRWVIRNRSDQDVTIRYELLMTCITNCQNGWYSYVARVPANGRFMSPYSVEAWKIISNRIVDVAASPLSPAPGTPSGESRRRREGGSTAELPSPVDATNQWKIEQARLEEQARKRAEENARLAKQRADAIAEEEQSRAERVVNERLRKAEREQHTSVTERPMEVTSTSNLPSSTEEQLRDAERALSEAQERKRQADQAVRDARATNVGTSLGTLIVGNKDGYAQLMELSRQRQEAAVKAQQEQRGARKDLQLAEIEVDRLRSALESARSEATDPSQLQVAGHEEIAPVQVAAIPDMITSESILVVQDSLITEAHTTANLDMISDRRRECAVHVASFRKEKNAQAEIVNLNRQGYHGRVVLVDLGAMGLWYRVYAGGFDNRADAEVARNALSELIEFKGAHVLAMSFAIQVSSYRAEKNALKDIMNLGNHGFSGWFAPKDLGDKGVWYRVYAGNYGSMQEARVACDALLRLPEYNCAQIQRHDEVLARDESFIVKRNAK